MESDPILTYAPRRHDGRLGLHQWPAGYPVAYDPEECDGKHAKTYQVRQVRAVILRYRLGGDL